MVALDWKKVALPVISMFRSSWLKSLPSVVSMLLLVAIAYNFSLLTWALLPDVEQQAYTDVYPAVSPVGKPVSNTARLADISRWHLFGKAGAVTVAAPKQEVVPETKLRLELRGILASPDAKFSRAIIFEPPRSEDTYGIGAALPGGATLVEINNDHIVLLRQGRREKLLLPREGMKSSPVASRATSSRSQRQHSPRRNTGLPVHSSSRLSELRTVLNNDPQSLMGLINAKPEIVDGKIKGFKLDGNQNGQLMRRFGLRRGDVVTAVNDIRLDGSANLPELLNELKTAEQVKIEYSRRGRPRSVVLNMDE